MPSICPRLMMVAVDLGLSHSICGAVRFGGSLCMISVQSLVGKILTSEPEPAVEKPEGHSDGVHYHFSLDPFLVLLFQEEKASVQLDNLSSE